MLKSSREASKKPVAGVGINDANYPIEECPFYHVWRRMMYRCYSESHHKIGPTYKDCTVSNEWHRFTEFKRWMEKQQWQGKHLDKDILVENNKEYGPNTCVFITRSLNNFIVKCKSEKGRLKGVSFYKRTGKYAAMCSNPFDRKKEHLGFYDTEIEAHDKWAERKASLAAKYAEIEDNPKLKEVLLNMNFKQDQLKGMYES